MRLALPFVLGFVLTAMLTQAGCLPRANAQAQGEVRIEERVYVPVPTPTKPVAPVKKKTWKQSAKETAQQIGRSGLFMVGVNAIVFGVRFGLAAFGLPVF